jgi:hypothetical protein
MFADISGNGMTITIVAPFLRAICIMLAFPDRGFMFDPIDDIPVRGIGFTAMGRSRDHNDSGIPYGDFADAVLRDGDMKLPFPAGFLQYLFYELCSKGDIGFVLEKIYGKPLVAVANFPAEEDDGPCTGMMGACQQANEIQRFGGDMTNLRCWGV